MEQPLGRLSLLGSCGLLAALIVIEAKTKAIPIIPLKMLKERVPVAVQISNICTGLAAYAYLFMLPLFFQVVLEDSAIKAGARLAIPSLAYPLGSLISGVVMSRFGRLIALVRAGSILMAFGNAIVATLGFHDPTWKYFVFIFPANLGQGLVYPGILFTSLAAFDHADHAVTASTIYLVRSMGSVYGVAITSTILQTVLSIQLPDALGEIQDKGRIIEEIRHSVTAIGDLPTEVQAVARGVYYTGIKYSFIASAASAGIAIIASLFLHGGGLRSTSK